MHAQTETACNSQANINLFAQGFQGAAACFQKPGKAGECETCPRQPSPPAQARHPGASGAGFSTCLHKQAETYCSSEPAQLCKRADVGGDGIKKAHGGAGGGSA